MSYNKIILVGNCTKEGEISYSQSGNGIYKNSIATTRKFTANGEKKEEVCFVDFTAFSRLSEICNQYLRKGSKIMVEGRLSFEQWIDQNGQKRSKHSVIVESMQMLDTKASLENQPQQHNYSQQDQGYSQNYSQSEQPQSNSIPEIDIDEDIIPF